MVSVTWLLRDKQENRWNTTRLLASTVNQSCVKGHDGEILSVLVDRKDFSQVVIFHIGLVIWRKTWVGIFQSQKHRRGHSRLGNSIEHYYFVNPLSPPKPIKALDMVPGPSDTKINERCTKVALLFLESIFYAPRILVLTHFSLSFLDPSFYWHFKKDRDYSRVCDC